MSSSQYEVKVADTKYAWRTDFAVYLGNCRPSPTGVLLLSSSVCEALRQSKDLVCTVPIVAIHSRFWQNRSEIADRQPQHQTLSYIEAEAPEGTMN